MCSKVILYNLRFLQKKCWKISGSLKLLTINAIDLQSMGVEEYEMLVHPILKYVGTRLLMIGSIGSRFGFGTARVFSGSETAKLSWLVGGA